MSYTHKLCLEKRYFETNKHAIKKWIVDDCNSLHVWLTITRASHSPDYVIIFDNTIDATVFKLKFGATDAS